jgi:hypothetical protein
MQIKQSTIAIQRRPILIMNVTCGNCAKEFDYNSVPEVRMGAVACPHCQSIIDQTGKVWFKGAKPSLGNRVWRIVTQPFKNTDTGEDDAHVELVGPGYYTRCDKNVSERLAVPKKVEGPFTFHNNGYGTMQISDGEGRMVATISFGKHNLRHMSGIKQPDEEEALWLVNTIVAALNNEQTTN